MTAPSGRAALALLVAVNLLPLVGVLAFRWDVAALVMLYWSENLVIGLYNILKMVAAGGLQAVFPALFFTLHYGGFCAVHGFFILSLLMGGAEFGDDRPWPFFLVFLQLLLDVIEQVLAQAPREWLIAFLALFVSHGYSFFTNFILGGERERATIRGLMGAPYQRIVVLHVAIIAGGFAVTALGEPLGLLLVLVSLKTALDVRLHLQERKRARGAEGADRPG
jgi:hypothetical protein